MNNVIEGVVNKNLCCGCGVCSALCPAGALTMRFNPYGELVPEETGSCIQSCTICNSVCPFIEKNPNEDALAAEYFSTIGGILHSDQCGYYLNSYVGYSNIGEQRTHGASGGLATWFLDQLFSTGMIDHAICAAPGDTHNRLFTFKIISKKNDLSNCAGSAYFPMELSEALQHIIKNPGRYAITALPCVAKGIRLASRKRRVLRERIIAILGLTCGQQKSSHFTRYIAAHAGLNGPPRKVHYRGKDSNQSADNFFFSFQNECDEKIVFWNSGPSKAWVNRWFTLNSCRFCDDVFAELADITLMDAWLPEYVGDSQGTNLAIVRNPLIETMIKEGINSGGLSLHPIELEKVIQSQWGVIEYKRHELAYRITRMIKSSNTITKRIAPGSKLGIMAKLRSRIRDIMQERSRLLSVRYIRTDGFNTGGFMIIMLPYLILLKLLEFINRIHRITAKVFGKISRL
ncbi:MAG TPA: Coenzyme F420 hydrogenase/dehydrogenase, beta subunit C-terminal domain [Spirochaetota bacterium]|nr:Coenzyme F420 hydrogenase/dehydrogenase, beta subunit C-terminal domain [Spirochaetota bacterium]HPG50940.1 Coenzyme F420 hydrogenase/dehydrogenase, beta subunit C-terminal domain [Spirochaetota bacterium]HPN12612.1 Coenzyme F420 hydrogenase/dehydrogenase, beta subunit C-terminal domain [Spirochaetota bacterium]